MSCRESLAKGPVQVGTLLRSKNGSDEMDLVLGCALSLYLSLFKSLTFPPITAYLCGRFCPFFLKNAKKRVYKLEKQEGL